MDYSNHGVHAQGGVRVTFNFLCHVKIRDYTFHESVGRTKSSAYTYRNSMELMNITRDLCFSIER